MCNYCLQKKKKSENFFFSLLHHTKVGGSLCPMAQHLVLKASIHTYTYTYTYTHTHTTHTNKQNNIRRKTSNVLYFCFAYYIALYCIVLYCVCVCVCVCVWDRRRRWGIRWWGDTMPKRSGRWLIDYNLGEGNNLLGSSYISLETQNVHVSL